MHPFASYILQSYYKATGWNEDNLYANLTRSSNGNAVVVRATLDLTIVCSSYSRLLDPSWLEHFGLQVAQCLIQDVVFDECNAFPEWLGWVHFHVVRLECQIVW